MKPYNTDQTKKEEVREMFDNIAPKYDLLNHTLSMSIDRVWRRRVVGEVRRAKPGRILDVATGTGDLAIAMARRIRDVQVLGVDLSEQMLAVARRKIEARGLDGRIVLDRGDAERLAVADASVDVATVAFGVRNFGDLGAGLRELARTIKTRGQSRYPGVFASPQPGVPGVVRILFLQNPAPHRRAGVARQAGLRVSSGLGRGVSRAGGVHGDDGPGGISQLPGAEPEFRYRTNIYRRKMKMRQRYSVYVLLLAVAVSLSSCRRAVEKARRNIRFEGIERVERQGLTGAEVVVRVMNDTGYKLVLDAAEMGVYYAGGRVGTVVLREAVEVPRRTTDSFRTLWQLKISDPLALYVLARKVKSGDLSQVEVSYAVEGRGGPAPVKISRERMPLSDFLNTFGLTIEDVKKQLK